MRDVFVPCLLLAALVLLAACRPAVSAVTAPRTEPLPVILNAVDCTPVHTAPTVFAPPSGCVAAGELALVWRAGRRDALAPFLPGRWYAINYRGYAGWVRLYAPSWVGRP